MQNERIYQRLNDVFRDVLDDPSIVLSSETVAADVRGWDSMNHVSLIVATEAEFKIKIKTAEMEGLKNVGEFVEVIARRLDGK